MTSAVYAPPSGWPPRVPVSYRHLIRCLSLQYRQKDAVRLVWVQRLGDTQLAQQLVRDTAFFPCGCPGDVHHISGTLFSSPTCAPVGGSCQEVCK